MKRHLFDTITACRHLWLLVLCLMLPLTVQAVDIDGDGSDATEEAFANTSDNDPTRRPYWWKTLQVNEGSYSSYFGRVVSRAGDVNGDGTPDWVISIPSINNVETNGESRSAARVYSGADATVLYTIYSNAPGDDLGIAVSELDDINSDGYDDFLIGAPGINDDTGSVIVASGLDGSTLYSFDGDTVGLRFGYQLNNAGDVNNDGYEDILISSESTNKAGRVFVYDGFDGSLIYEYSGQNAYDSFGSAINTAGDLNQDGYADFIIGIPYANSTANDSGAVEVYSGADGSLLYSYDGDGAGDVFGSAVADAGDVNNDGYNDFIVGAIQLYTQAVRGYTRVYSGYDGTILHTFTGEYNAESLGRDVSRAGDINGDGYGDVMTSSRASGDKGTVIIFSGATGQPLYRFRGDDVGDGLGKSISLVGDIEQDGYEDILVGIYTDDNINHSSGSARILLTSDFFNDADSDFKLSAYDPDDDQDGFLDGDDNCPSVINIDQSDSDSDGIGDACDFVIGIDTDNDGWSDSDEVACGTDPVLASSLPANSDEDHVCDVRDAFPLNRYEWNDNDSDGIGDNADDDDDNDSVLDIDDNCSFSDNLDQLDYDGDGSGNVCDNTIYGDVDNDNIDDLSDNCPYLVNTDQIDTDSDGLGDTCDTDQGGTELVMEPGAKIKANGGHVIIKVMDADAGYTSHLYLTSPDNRFIASNRDAGTIVNLGIYPVGTELIFSIQVQDTGYEFFTGPAERNPDNELHAAAYIPPQGTAIIGFEDLHGGGDQDFNDNVFRFLGLSAFEDFDGDGIGDFYDDDDDNDGVPDIDDLYPFDPTESADNDSDGIGNNADNCPNHSNPFQTDSDGDGTGDICEPSVLDEDGDGSSLYEENLAGTSDDDANSRPYWWRTFDGEHEVSLFGSRVNRVGDVNNDGHDDIIVATEFDSNNGYFSNGVVHIISGNDGQYLYTYTGESDNALMSRSISGVGDINNDSYDDFAIGRIYDNTYAPGNGRIDVFSGRDGHLVYSHYGDSDGDALGYEISALDDINFDGYDDFLVSAPVADNGGEQRGTVYIISGADNSRLTTIYGETDAGLFGFALASTGDIDMDGINDFLVHEKYKVYIFSGIDGELIDTISSSQLSFARSLHNAGDVNNDDYPDIIVSDEQTNPLGSAHVYSGKDRSLLYTFTGTQQYSSFGNLVDGAGDINGDGYADLLVSAHRFDSPTLDTGKVFLFSGADGSILYTFVGDSRSDMFGSSLRNVGDLDADGYDDFAVGAPEDDNTDRNSGSLRVFLSSDLRADIDLDFILDSSVDLDGDGLINGIDWDDDGDGVPDSVDATPFDSGNTSEIALPLNNTESGYKGLRVQSSLQR